jgi:hypothetical protein
MDIKIEFNPEKIVGKLSELGRVQLPIAASIALNQTAFKIREELQNEAKNKFKDPVPFTLNAFLYKKATPENLEAVVFIREDAPKGNAPADYLAPHIYNGPAYRTRFQKGLGRTIDPSPIAMGSSMLAPNRLMRPTQSPRGVRFTQRGLMSPGQYEQILSYLQNTDSTRTANTGRVSGRKAGFAYFYMNQAMIDERRNLKNRRPGIFMRQGGKYPLMRVMTEVATPSFSSKFRFFEVGTETATVYFPQFLSKQKFL